MYKVINDVKVADKRPKNGNGFLSVNPNPTPTHDGRYSALITGWSNPDRFGWDYVPNLLVKGTLYNDETGVDLLIENLQANPQIDRVYLLAVTKFDTVANSCTQAFKRLDSLGYDCTICYLEKPAKQEIAVSKQIKLKHLALLKRIVDYGNHYQDRGFTALTNQTVRFSEFDCPDYHPYFDQWLSTEQAVTGDVSYTYGSKIALGLSGLISGSETSTQRILTLLDNGIVDGSVSAGIPCLTQLSYFDGELTAVFRSHDIGKAYVMNVQALMYCYCQWFPRVEFNDRKLTVISQNAHIYDHFDKSQIPEFVGDSEGYFYFKKLGDTYQIYHNDSLVYQSKSKTNLKGYFTKNHPNLSTEHSFWILTQIGEL